LPKNDYLADSVVRMAAFDWLREQVDRRGEVFSRADLLAGFTLQDKRVPLVAPQQGIYNPKGVLDAPLSITTTPKSPYSDSFRPDGLLLYSYRGTDPEHSDNRGLRHAMLRRLPLVYFHGLLPGKYLATWPVFIVGDEPKSLKFTVAVDAPSAAFLAAATLSDEHAIADPEAGTDARRRYITATFRVRLHQRVFRERVLDAYRSQCALCRLRHEQLLDAAHIIPDIEVVGGEPVVTNGLSLCKLHHAAYDSHFLTVRSDYVIEVRQSLLDEEDGPMLLHGLKAMHGQRILLPQSRRQYPDPKRLDLRYERFKQAG